MYRSRFADDTIYHNTDTSQLSATVWPVVQNFHIVVLFAFSWRAFSS